MISQVQRKKAVLFLLCLLIGSLFLGTPVGQAEEEKLILKEGMKSEAVWELQIKLQKLGFLAVNPTGYFGSLTTKAVKEFQLTQGLKVDGVAGSTTLKQLSDKGTDNKTKKSKKAVHRSGQRVGELIPWFGWGERIFPRGGTAWVTDVDTGLSFEVRRIQGRNHADCEPLTAQDTNIIMRSLYNGNWSWDRRAIIVTVGTRRIAASMNGMPHGNDYIENNGMDGHFCIHFYGSRTHGSNSVDDGHQSLVRKAAGSR